MAPTTDIVQQGLDIFTTVKPALKEILGLIAKYAPTSPFKNFVMSLLTHLKSRPKSTSQTLLTAPVLSALAISLINTSVVYQLTNTLFKTWNAQSKRPTALGRLIHAAVAASAVAAIQVAATEVEDSYIYDVVSYDETTKTLVVANSDELSVGTKYQIDQSDRSGQGLQATGTATDVFTIVLDADTPFEPPMQLIIAPQEAQTSSEATGFEYNVIDYDPSLRRLSVFAKDHSWKLDANSRYQIEYISSAMITDILANGTALSEAVIELDQRAPFTPGTTVIITKIDDLGDVVSNATLIKLSDNGQQGPGALVTYAISPSLSQLGITCNTFTINQTGQRGMLGSKVNDTQIQVVGADQFAGSVKVSC